MIVIFWYSHRWGLITSAPCWANLSGSRPLSASLMKSQFWSTNVNMVCRQCTCVVDQQTIQTTTTFCLINIFGCSTYSSVHCRWQSVSCRSRSSVEQSSIARHCCPPLSILCCRLKSHLFSLSYPAFWLFSHLYSAHTVSGHFGHYNLFLHLTF